jgi:hypothetical protein
MTKSAEGSLASTSVIFLASLGHEIYQLTDIMRREGFSSYEELEPKDGFRRFRLTKG